MKIKHYLYATIILIFCSPAIAAENIHSIEVDGVSIDIPVPNGYVDASKKRRVPPNGAVFNTEAVEDWERSNEFNEDILVYGLAFSSTDNKIITQKFEQAFDFTYQKIQARIEKKEFKLPSTAEANRDNFTFLYQHAGGENAKTVTITQNDPNRKSFIVHTRFVMPGVTSVPIIEETSFVRVKDRMIVIHNTRVAIDKDVEKQVLETSQTLRDAIWKASQD